jgi:cobalt transporter subunit CbtB
MGSSSLTTVGSLTGRKSAVVPVVAAILLGVFLIYGTGFAGSHVIHEAAHDARHAFPFPCH